MPVNTSGLRPPWKPGESGGGRGCPKTYSKFRKWCREATPEAMEALKAALLNPKERVPAAKTLLEFAWGRAPSAEVMATLDKQHAQKGREVREEALEAVSDALVDAANSEPH